MPNSTFTYPPIQAALFQNENYKPLSVPWTSWLNRIAILSGEGAVLGGENIGTLGIGVFSQRLDTLLQFKNIVALDSSVSVTLSGDNIRIGANLPTVPSFATQTEVEAGTSTTTTVSPATVKYNPGIAKAWIRFTNAAILASYNVTSITDNGNGDFYINFTTAFSSANYAIAAIASNNSILSDQARSINVGEAPTVSTCRILFGYVDAAGKLVPADENIMSAAFYGDFS